MGVRRLLAIISFVVVGLVILPGVGQCKSFKVVNGVPYFEAKPGRFYKLIPGGAPPTAHKLSETLKTGGKSKAPAAVDLSSQMPPVGDCGNQNSSSAWASTYYYKTFQEAKEHNWSVATTDHQYSPAFTYNQTNYGSDNGANLSDAMQLLVNKGATTLAQQPYSDTNYTGWPTLMQYRQALPARAQSAASIFRGYGNGAAQLERMKAILAGGDIFVVSIAMFADFDVTEPSYLYDEPGNTEYVGQLALTIVGYDDTVGGVGGFKFRNCWGKDWGDNGSGYLSYWFMSNYTYEAWTMTDRIDYTPQMLSRITIQHPRRIDLTITLGHGETASPDWSQVIYANQGGYGQNVDCYVDVTDFPQVDGVWWVKIADRYSSATGTLTRFSLLKGEAEMTSTDTPLVIPDMSSTIARLRWVLDSFLVEVNTAPGSAALTEQNSVTVNYTAYGVPGSAVLWNGKQVTVQADDGIEMQFSDLSTSSDDSVRWKLGPTIVQANPGGGKAASITRTYYQQYRKLFGTATQCGPALSPENAVVVTYNNCGAKATVDVHDAVTEANAVWADRTSRYSFARLSKGSSGTDRWSGGKVLSDTVSDNSAVSASYWHQYYPLLSFTGTDRNHTVGLSERTLFGEPVLVTGLVKKWTGWCDDGSTLAVGNATTGTPSRRSFDTLSWTVDESFSATANYSAYFTVSGRVTDRENNPVSGVVVRVGTLELTTDEQGRYQVDDLVAGTYALVPVKIGCAFAPPRKTVKVGAKLGDSLNNDFVLTTVPSITNWTPKGSEVQPTTAVSVLFSEAMDPESVQAAFRLQETFPGSTSLGPAATGVFTWSQENRRLTFQPAARLKAYRSYRVTIGATAQSAPGGPLGADFQWTFQTNDCLSVVSYGPTSNAAGCNSPISMVFDRDVDQASVRSAFSMIPEIYGALSFPTPRTLQFVPRAPLSTDLACTVTLGSRAKGLDGVTLVQPFTWTFTTQGPVQVSSVTPTGSGAALSSQVVVTFDRPMRKEITRQAFSLIVAKTPLAVSGKYSWNARGTVLTFQPAQWLTNNTTYTVRIAASAESAEGAPLAAPYQSTFNTGDMVHVVSATPTGTAAAVNEPLRLHFDRPVRPGTLQLTLQPTVQGTLTWSDTATAVFTPQANLLVSTLYTATVGAGLTAEDGSSLPAPYTWSFTTHGLTQVVRYGPQGAGVKPGAAIGIRFDRPMNQASVATNLQVFLLGSTTQQITGELTWNAEGTLLTFIPQTRLASFADYRVVLNRNALSADGLALSSKLEWIFQTARSVQVLSYSPSGEQAGLDSVITVKFDRRMGRASVQNTFSLEPAVAGTFEWPTNYELRFRPTAGLQAGQRYRVRVGGGARALDGTWLVSPFEFSFGTAGGALLAATPTAVTAAQTTGGNVAISFTLSAPAQVEVTVLNLAGRPVATLGTSGTGAAGANTLLWNGKSASGSKTPAGTYLVKVATRTASGGQSVTLTPLQLR